MADAYDTFPRLLLHHATARGDRPAIREKDLGIWQTWTWSEVATEVQRLAAGFASQGLKRGMNLAIIGGNRPRLYWSMLAAQALGAVPIPLYQDAAANEMVFVLQNAEVEIAIVEDQEQVDKLLEVLPQCPQLARIVFDEGRGLRHYTQPQLLSYDALIEAGKAVAPNAAEFFAAEVAKGSAEDVSVILYTSGTTGHPKGVCHTHRSTMSMSQADVTFDGLTAADSIVSYLPMAWVGDHLFSFGQAMVAGFCICCPESSETVMTDLREIGPTYFFAPPRVFENILTQVSIRIEDAAWAKKKLYNYFMNVARRVGMQIMEGKAVGLGDRVLYGLGQFFVYGPLKNVLGMSRIRIAYTGGAAIGPDLFNFYRSIGVNLKQLYGMTETMVSVCMHPNGQVKLDTVGVPMKSVEIKLSESGEILVRSPGLLKEYYKRPDATAEALDPNGFFRTGDAGFFDADGHLKIIDRAKDVGKTAAGALFAPQYVENKLKFFPYIKEAVAFGDKRERVCAILNIDFEAVGNWAERRGLAYSGYGDLAAQPAVYNLVRECVEQVNADLAADPNLAGSQVARFVILHKELDADDGELTRTRKVRRGFIAEKYATIVDALYSDKAECFLELQVKFEDGRTGAVSATLKIADAKHRDAVKVAA